MSLKTVTPPRRLWRVGRIPDAVRFNPPVGVQNITRDTVGQRFDTIITPVDTLYVASSPEDAYAEVLFELVPDPSARGLLPEDDTIGEGCIDANFRSVRRLCEIELSATTSVPALNFVDVSDADNLAKLDASLRPMLAALGVKRLDLPTITSSRRSVTHAVAEFVASCVDAGGSRLYAGIRYPSKHGTNHECWAVFSGLNYTVISAHEPSATDEAMLKIAKRLGLRVH